MAYVKDLDRIFEVGAAEEHREFLKSFVKRIFWVYDMVNVNTEISLG